MAAASAGGATDSSGLKSAHWRAPVSSCKQQVYTQGCARSHT
jgi:hypothetical protein